MNSLIKKAYIEYKSPSNIAFIKYWGKKDFQIPENPSLSMTLSNCFTQMSIEFIQHDGFELSEFLFEGVENKAFKTKLNEKIISFIPDLPFLNHFKLKIKSSNSFPHSSGIASSASAFSALILCLLKMESKVLDQKIDINRASSFSRLCSGSAARSLYNGYSHWGKSHLANSSNLYASEICYDIDLCDSIAIVNSSEKSVSSSLGHKLMDTNPYRFIRYTQAALNLKTMDNALSRKDLNLFGEILEQEAMELHALMMCSKPSFILLEENSFQIINKVRDFRVDKKLPLYFTIDAGPNIHLIYPKSISEPVLEFIDKSILPLSQSVIHDFIGTGPELLDEVYDMDTNE
jgi:diphosphomevalonate decarboxylase